MTHPDTIAELGYLRGLVPKLEASQNRVAQLEKENAAQLAEFTKLAEFNTNSFNLAVKLNEELLDALKKRQSGSWQPIKNEAITSKEDYHIDLFIDQLGDIVFEDRIIMLPEGVAVCRLVKPS